VTTSVFYVEVLGVVCVVRIDDETFAPVADAWAACRIPATDAAVVINVIPTDLGYRAEVDGHAWEIEGPDGAMAATSTAINAVATTRTQLLAVHAAVVARDGITLVVPGSSGTGKSTLTLGLLQQDWDYVSDEALALDWSAESPYAYPRPVAASDWTLERLGLAGPRTPGRRSGIETWFTPDALGARVSERPPPVSLIALPHRGEPDVSVQPAHRGEALDLLVRRGFTVHRAPARALDALADVVRGATVVHLTYTDPRAAAELLGDTAERLTREGRAT
jgi:hypothetical protein